ncbi:unnamed protein product [Lampetra planeri]
MRAPKWRSNARELLSWRSSSSGSSLSSERAQCDARQCASARQPLTSAALISPARRGVTPPPPPPPPLPGGGERLAGLRGTAPRVPGPATRHGSHGFFAGVTTPCNSTLAHDGSNTAQELNAEAP